MIQSRFAARRREPAPPPPPAQSTMPEGQSDSDYLVHVLRLVARDDPALRLLMSDLDAWAKLRLTTEDLEHRPAWQALNAIGATSSLVLQVSLSESKRVQLLIRDCPDVTALELGQRFEAWFLAFGGIGNTGRHAGITLVQEPSERVLRFPPAAVETYEFALYQMIEGDPKLWQRRSLRWHAKTWNRYASDVIALTLHHLYGLPMFVATPAANGSEKSDEAHYFCRLADGRPVNAIGISAPMSDDAVQPVDPAELLSSAASARRMDYEFDLETLAAPQWVMRYLQPQLASEHVSLLPYGPVADVGQQRSLGLAHDYLERVLKQEAALRAPKTAAGTEKYETLGANWQETLSTVAAPA
jgi:hypothetical protein